jgi:hypothetical protein
MMSSSDHNNEPSCYTKITLPHLYFKKMFSVKNYLFSRDKITKQKTFIVRRTETADKRQSDRELKMKMK